MALIPLDSKKHRYDGWKRYSDYKFSAGDLAVPVLFPELSHLMPGYPLAFVRIKDLGFQLVALLGIHEKENLFVNEHEKWRFPYVPAMYRSYPFTLRQTVIEDETKQVLCFDDSSGLFRENPDAVLGDERFFDDDGKPQTLLAQLMSFLHSMMSSRLLINRAVQSLASLNLLVPWTLPFANPSSDRPLIKGLFRIDEKALNALNGQMLEILHKVNALPVAYAQLFSMRRADVLLHLYNLRYSKPNEPKTGELPLTLDSLFGEGNDETINFDWLK